MSSITWDVLNPDVPATYLFPAFEKKIYQMVEKIEGLPESFKSPAIPHIGCLCE